MAQSMKTRCCIVGGGPAGMMLGYLLGRAGVDVVVLEKHADFFRDFRGDTVHPSTLQVMDELGLIDGFLKLPHQRLQKMDGMFGGTPVRIADLSRLHGQIPLHRLHAAMGLSQFPARERARRFASLKVMMSTEAIDLIREDGAHRRRAGEDAGGHDRHRGRSDRRLRRPPFHRCANAPAFAVEEIGAPMDVLWFRAGKRARRDREACSPASIPAR